jgi:tetrahydromethanopterin S-methyltransferase subunit C
LPIDGLMGSSVTNLVKALGLIAIGVAIGAAGIYIGDTDDAPGAALIGLLLMIGAVVLGVRTARRKA